MFQYWDNGGSFEACRHHMLSQTLVEYKGEDVSQLVSAPPPDMSQDAVRPRRFPNALPLQSCIVDFCLPYNSFCSLIVSLSGGEIIL